MKSTEFILRQSKNDKEPVGRQCSREGKKRGGGVDSAADDRIHQASRPPHIYIADTTRL